MHFDRNIPPYLSQKSIATIICHEECSVFAPTLNKKLYQRPCQGYFENMTAAISRVKAECLEKERISGVHSRDI
jgi:hypothetical protein